MLQAIETSRLLLILITFFALCCGCVDASFDGGDAAALIIGLIIGILGICACLGAYSRKRSAGQ